MSNQAIQPLGECKSNVDLFRALAQRMGLEEDSLTESDDSMIDQALASGSPKLQGIDRQRLEKEGTPDSTSPGAGTITRFYLLLKGTSPRQAAKQSSTASN